MSQYELFQSQTMAIMRLLADTARDEICKVYHDNNKYAEKELKLVSFYTKYQQTKNIG